MRYFTALATLILLAAPLAAQEIDFVALDRSMFVEYHAALKADPRTAPILEDAGRWVGSKPWVAETIELGSPPWTTHDEWAGRYNQPVRHPQDGILHLTDGNVRVNAYLIEAGVKPEHLPHRSMVQPLERSSSDRSMLYYFGESIADAIRPEPEPPPDPEPGEPETPECEQPCALGIEIKVEWRDPERGWLPANTLEWSDRAWVATFLNEANPELFVKILDGCDVNGHRWLFAGGATDQVVRIAAVDTWGGTEKIYQNEPGPYTAVTDSEAFDCVEPPVAEPPWLWPGAPITSFDCESMGWLGEDGLEVRAQEIWPRGESRYVVLQEEGTVRLRGLPMDAQFHGSTELWSATMTRRDARRLEEQEGVLVVEPLIEFGPAVESWGLDRIDQRKLPLDGIFNRPESGGEGVHVYIADTGLDANHPEFEGRVGEGFTVDDDGDWSDEHGHGTHVASTAAGTTLGIANRATIHAVEVIPRGYGTSAGVAEGMYWIRDNAKRPAVVNMSIGGNKSTIVARAVCSVINAGIPVAVAAGNDNDLACSYTPSAVWQAMTVGSLQKGDQRAYYSNHGACVQLFAPGSQINGALPGGGTGLKSGTSMASPHVAGAMALCLAENRDERCIFDAVTKGEINLLPDNTVNKLLYLDP